MRVGDHRSASSEGRALVSATRSCFYWLLRRHRAPQGCASRPPPGRPSIHHRWQRALFTWSYHQTCGSPSHLRHTLAMLRSVIRQSPTLAAAGVIASSPFVWGLAAASPNPSAASGPHSQCGCLAEKWRPCGRSARSGRTGENLARVGGTSLDGGRFLVRPRVPTAQQRAGPVHAAGDAGPGTALPCVAVHVARHFLSSTRARS